MAKRMQAPCTPEEFGLALAKLFVDEYPKVRRGLAPVRDRCSMSTGCWGAG